MAQFIEIVTVFIATANRQHARADHRGVSMDGPSRITGVMKAGRKNVGELQPSLNLAQYHNTAVGRKRAAVKAGVDFHRPTGDKPGRK